MARASLSCVLFCVTVAGCSGDDSEGHAYTDSAGTSTDTGAAGSESTGESGGTGDTGTDGTDTGDPNLDSLRFVAYGSYESVLLSFTLDDALNVPPPETLANGTEIAGMFGPTPFGAEAVTHQGQIDQLRLTPEGEMVLSPLATQEGNWLHSLWFADDGANALVSAGSVPYAAPEKLLWVNYDAEGEVKWSSDITPPLEPGGTILVIARSPDSSMAVVLIDVEVNDIWQLYLLPLEPELSESIFIDHVTLEGIPATNVPAFIWAHLDNERLIFRNELEANVLVPMAVALDDPATPPVNLAPTLGHISSIVVSDDNSRMLVTTDGANGYRDLHLIELDGPTSAQPPMLITQPGAPALTELLLPGGPPTPGHGFDAQGRIWYAYTDTLLPDPVSVGIKLVTVVDGLIMNEFELTDPAPGTEIDELRFDADAQILGYRSHTTNLSSINYVDLGELIPARIRVDQSFSHFPSEPGDNADYGWSADGSRIAVLGIQDGDTRLHVAEIGDPSGATVEVTLPDIEATPGVALTHRPSVSPNGDQLVLWYGIQTGRKGLIHAPTDGSAAAEVILGLDYSLLGGAFMPHAPK